MRDTSDPKIIYYCTSHKDVFNKTGINRSALWKILNKKQVPLFKTWVASNGYREARWGRTNIFYPRSMTTILQLKEEIIILHKTVQDLVKILESHNHTILQEQQRQAGVIHCMHNCLSNIFENDEDDDLELEQLFELNESDNPGLDAGAPAS